MGTCPFMIVTTQYEALKKHSSLVCAAAQKPLSLPSERSQQTRPRSRPIHSALGFFFSPPDALFEPQPHLTKLLPCDGVIRYWHKPLSCTKM